MIEAPVGMHGLTALPIVNGPVPKTAKLRVTTNPIYDSELTGTTSITELNFFRSPEGGVMQNATTTKKTLADTNLKQPGQLGSPLVFDMTGFNIRAIGISVTTPLAVSESQFFKLIQASYFEFQFNNRPFLQIPMAAMPTGIGPVCGTTSTANATYPVLTNGVATTANIFKFMVGNYRVRILSTENFNAKIAWPSTVAFADTYSVGIKVQLQLSGYLYNAI